MSVVFQSEKPYLQVMKDAVVNATYETEIIEAEYNSKGGGMLALQNTGAYLHSRTHSTTNLSVTSGKIEGNAIKVGLEMEARRSEKQATYSFVDDDENNEAYIFCEGEDHNQLTLTDEGEIEAMRAFISHLDYVTEITEEEEEEE